MRKLYLHVGVHRTATTSIQRFMRANFAALVDKGYLYPYGVARHNAVVARMRYGTQNVAEFAEELARRMAAKGDHVTAAVLSDEDMSMIADFNLFAPMKRVFDVKVVVSLRRQDLWLESWYLQNLKWQWNPDMAHLTFDEFWARRAEFFWIDYAARLQRYEKVFGTGSVVAQVFEEADMPDGPIDAFLAMIGITDQTGFGQQLHHNSSLSPLATEFMRHLPLDEMDGPDRRLFERASLTVDAGLKGNGSKLVMSHPRRLAVQAEYAQSNAAVARKYFNRDVLFRDPLPDASAPLAINQLPGDSARLMQDFIVPFVRALGAEIAEARTAEVEETEAPPRPRRQGQGPKKDRLRSRT